MKFKLKALERRQSGENSVPVQHHLVNTSGRVFALAEIRTFPLSTLKVADVQISASLSRVPPLAELNEMVQYISVCTGTLEGSRHEQLRVSNIGEPIYNTLSLASAARTSLIDIPIRHLRLQCIQAHSCLYGSRRITSGWGRYRCNALICFFTM